MGICWQSVNLWKKYHIEYWCGGLFTSLPESCEWKVIWKTGTYDAAYASINKRNNVEEFFLFHADGLSVHRMNDGYEKLFYQHKTRYGINASQPVEIGDKVLLSSAYGKGTVFG